MKPKDYSAPFQWTQPQVLIKDQVLYTFGEGKECFSFPGWEAPEVFPSKQPVKVEYCSGNGAWVAEQAQREPDVNWVAVEKRFMRVRKIRSKIDNHALSNLFTVCGEALDATTRYFAPLSVEEVYVNFPDPWPKKRQAKYRLIQTPFVQAVATILKPGGKFILVTDHEAYSHQMIQLCRAHPSFTSFYPAPYFVTSWDGYGESYFDSLWRSQGKTIHYHTFIKS